MITREIVRRGGNLPPVLSKRERYGSLFIIKIAIHINKGNLSICYIMYQFITLMFCCKSLFFML
jgi:hypothetical protein